MKSSKFFLRILLAGLSAVAVSSLLAGCGQKGPLYLAKPPEHVVRTAPAADNADNTAAGKTNGAAATATPAK